MNVEFISAGAGSGKTWELTRLIAEAMENGMAPERITATTFTVKAADELRSRVVSHFFEKRDFQMVLTAPAIVIGTVNSVCGRLLSRFAFESGLSPRLSVIEPEEAESVLGRVLETCVDEKIRKRLIELERRFAIDRDDEDSWIATTLGLVGAARANGMDAAALLRMADGAAAGLVACLDAPDPSLASDPTAALAASIESALPGMDAGQEVKEQKNSARYIQLCRDALTAIRGGRWTWRDWVLLARGEYGKNIATEAGAVEGCAARFTAHPALRADIQDYVHLCFDAASSSLQSFAEEKQRLGVVDFVDQESLLYGILDLPSVKDRLSEELGFLLVDEFQDTSPLQLAIFLKLAALAERTVWVGDVKQAIYGFRGSDAGLMAAITKSIQGIGGTRRVLGSSWRSRPGLVFFANAVFVPAFSGELSAESVALKAERKEYAPVPVFERWTLPGRQSDQAEAIAAGVRGLLSRKFPVRASGEEGVRPVEPGDIAVFARSNDAAARIREALAAEGIPCSGDAGDPILSPEGVLLRACLRRIDDPKDSLASAEILSLTQGLSPGDWLLERIAWVENPDNPADLWRCSGTGANPVLKALEELRPSAVALSPSEIAAAVVGRCHVDKFAASFSSDAAEAQRRVEALGSLLQSIDDFEAEGSSGAVSLSRLVLWLEERAAAASEDGPWRSSKSAATSSGADPRPEARGVEVLTYHGAKGLEWPVCICHDACKAVKDRCWGLTVRKAASFDISAPLAGRSLRVWPRPFRRLENVVDTTKDPDLAAIEKETREEERRLLYVGFTRARDLLILTRPEKVAAESSLSTLGPEALRVIDSVPDGEATVRLPDGTSMRCAGHTIMLDDERPIPKKPRQPLFWPQTIDSPLDFPQAILYPSSIAADSVDGGPLAPRLVESYARGGVLLRTPSNELGLAYHALIAWKASNPEAPSTPEALGDFLLRAAAGDAFDRDRLAENLQGLFSWIKSRWPGARLFAESPLTAPLTDGRLLEGRIDLLIDTPQGLVLIDHKLGKTETPREWLPQIEAYARGLAIATGKRPLEAWINLPERGELVRIM